VSAGPRLAGQVAVVTGGSGALGVAIARALLAEGAAAVVLTGRDPARGERAAAELGDRAHFRKQDVTDPTRWPDLLAEVVAAFGRLDLLVNNAGWVGRGGPQNPLHTSLDEWREVLAVNLDGVFLGCRAGIAAMSGTGGCLVNVSSTAGQLSTPSFVAYGAAKAAVAHLSKSVAVYCARAGLDIRCNSVHPALVESSLGDDVLRLFDADVARARANYLGRVPLGRLAVPEDVAGAVVYLASDAARYVTGTELVVGGGLGV
jgi:3(or 17)beta-hydroxysteroid dehydrogenase